MGCLFVFGRMVAQTFFRLGGILVTMMIRSMTFLLITVIGPLGLGAVREFVVRALRVTRNGRPVHSTWQVNNRTIYALLSGMVWVAAFFLIRGGLRLLGWIGTRAAASLAPSLAPWLPMVLLVALIFTIGTAVGAVVHQHDNGIFM